MNTLTPAILGTINERTTSLNEEHITESPG